MFIRVIRRARHRSDRLSFEHRTRLVCLGVSPSPRVRCLSACFTYLLTYLRLSLHCSPRTRSRSLVIRSASSVSLRIVALPAADAASRVNGPTYAHAGGRGDTFPSLAIARARRSCPALHWTLTGCSAKSIVLLSPALWAGEQRRIIQPRCLAASAALRRQRCRARVVASRPRRARRMERTRRRAPLLLISRRALRASRVASRRRSGCWIGRLMKPKEAQLVVDA